MTSPGPPLPPWPASLPAHPSPGQARDWVARQRRRRSEGTGFSFAIANAATGRAVGTIGLWLRNLPSGRGSAGYSVSPLHRGQGIAASALTALTSFAWSIPGLFRVELYIEPWNTGSIHVAQAAGYQREGLLRSYQVIGVTRCDMCLYAAIRPELRES
jgi:[ribosomal protein S5]-alanine N-acetyltransferase